MTVDIAQAALQERFDWVALDFVNTRLVTRAGHLDALHDVEHLHTWMDLVAPPGWDELRPRGVTDRRTFHAEAVRLRVAIDALMAATADQRPVDEPVVEALARALRWTRTTSHLAVGASGRLVLESRYEPLHPAAVLGPIAEDAVRLSSTVDPARLRRCRADTCLRWFVDTSKGGRRAWCSMATCGNRAKAARYRARHEETVDVFG